MIQLNPYKVTGISTLSPGRLIVALYDGAIKYLKQAIVELEAGNFTEKGQKINQAVQVIQELQLSLNLEMGGEVAKNLDKLYDFMVRHLAKANMTKDTQKIREVIGLLTDLNQAWKTITA